MRRLLAVLLLSAVLVCAGTASAQAFMIGYPRIETGKYTVSAQYMSVDVDLERKGDGNDKWNLDSSLLLLRGSYGLASDGEFFVVFGANNSNFRDSHDPVSTGGSLNASTEITIGGGLRGLLYKTRRIEITGAVQGQISSNINGVFVRDDGTRISGAFDLVDLQAAVNLVYPMGDFRPYAGLHFEQYKINVGGDLGGVDRLRQEKEFGAVAGVNYRISRNWNLDVEGQVLSSSNFGVSVNYIFW